MAYSAVLALAWISAAFRHENAVHVESWQAHAAGVTGGDLAHLAAGARLSVSSFDVDRACHPLYLIDGERESSSGVNFWANAPGDTKPWIRLEFAQRADVSHAQLFFASTGDPNDLPQTAVLTCERREHDRVVNTGSHRLTVTGSIGTALDTPCAGTDVVTIEFLSKPTLNSTRFAVTEVAIWERPR